MKEISQNDNASFNRMDVCIAVKTVGSVYLVQIASVAVESTFAQTP